MFCSVCCVFFFKQKTAYEMRISDWSSDVCSSDLMREAITSCRRFRISRAEVAAEILMFHRYQKAVAVSNGMMRATSFCQRKSVADLSPRASPAPQSPRLSAPQESAQPEIGRAHV